MCHARASTRRPHAHLTLSRLEFLVCCAVRLSLCFGRLLCLGLDLLPCALLALLGSDVVVLVSPHPPCELLQLQQTLHVLQQRKKGKADAGGGERGGQEEAGEGRGDMSKGSRAGKGSESMADMLL